MKRLTLLVLTALLIPIGSLAADVNKMYRNISPTGYDSCSEFIAASDECHQGYCVRFAIFRAWLQGYMTSYNIMTPDTFDIAGGKAREASDKSLEGWLENYCKQNPSKGFTEAVEELTIDLYPTRLKTQPKD
jgi:hypothetical protein